MGAATRVSPRLQQRARRLPPAAVQGQPTERFGGPARMARAEWTFPTTCGRPRTILFCSQMFSAFDCRVLL
jgi:hypothetical protein